jgi:Ca2+-transporting ATPase
MDPAVTNKSCDKNWHCMTSDAVLQYLDVSATGLTTAQAAKMRAFSGANIVAETKPIIAWEIFFSQFRSILVWILIIASIVSGVIGDATDSIVILAIVFLNALVGFYQEYSAEKTISVLRKMTAPRTKVWRDGSVKTIASADVVPGDVLELEAGDLVAADARLLSATSLTCVESALTGEAETVVKNFLKLDVPEISIGDRANMVFMGTTIATGAGRAVVISTAMQTELGRIASLISEAAAIEVTPLQEKLDKFGRILLWATLGIVSLLFGLGLLRKEPIFDLLMTSVSLAVAALPESLPAVATAALSLGVMRMSQRRALVRRLASVETLGSTNVICTDKTGTLTVGQMTVRVMVVAGKSYNITGEGYDARGEVWENDTVIDTLKHPSLRQMAEILVGCNNAHIEQDDNNLSVVGDPTEGALLCAGIKVGADRSALERECPRVHELPFDSDRKLHTVIRQSSGRRLRIMTNGAPEMLLSKCSYILQENGVRPLTSADQEMIHQQNLRLAERGLRVLASGFRDIDALPFEQLSLIEVESDLVFAGLSGLYDPPRPEAKEAVRKCLAAGIRVVMISGDHPCTALAIGRELGLSETIRSATGIEMDRLTDDKIEQLVPTIDVFARVSAAHKLRIVQAWQANGAVVAMTGDGVNDAPAIKGADIGIAMGRTGTEVTKQASDMIITDDNFASIVAAVEEGRGIYDNIRKTLQYLLACNASELLLMAISIVAGLPMPLLPIHLLWINLVSDGPPALCLAADRVDPAVMKQPPRRRGEQLADKDFFQGMLLVASLVAGVGLVTFLYGLQSGGVELARTYAFNTMVFTQLLLAFGARSQTMPLWRLRFFSNFNLPVVVTALIFIQIWSQQNESFSHFLGTVTLPYQDGVVMLTISALPLVVIEVLKALSQLTTTQDHSHAVTMSWLSHWTTAAAIAAMILGGWFYWPRQHESFTKFVTQIVDRGSITRVVTATGSVVIKSTTMIFAPLSGVVDFHGCEVGESVKKGQLCATVDRHRYSLALDHEQKRLHHAEVHLESSRKILTQAKSVLKSARASRSKKKISTARLSYERAIEQVSRATTARLRSEASQRAAEVNLAHTEIRSPIDGIIASRRVNTGHNMITEQSTLFTLSDLSGAEIEVALSASEIEEVKLGDRGKMQLEAIPGQIFNVQVKEIRKTQGNALLVVLGSDFRFKPDMKATANIEVDSRNNVIRVPNKALSYSQRRAEVSRDGKKADNITSLLWVLHDGVPASVQIDLGLDDGMYTEITRGNIQPGDKLIVGTED